VSEFAGTRLATAALGGAVAGASAAHVADAAAVAAVLALAAVAAARTEGRAYAVAPFAVAAAFVGVLALPNGVALASAGAAVGAAALLVVVSRREPPVPPPSRGWRIDELERLVEAHADEYPARAEEWRAYVELLRAHAAGGILPPAFDALVADVFVELLER
jgi:hypothetical protein